MNNSGKKKTTQMDKLINIIIVLVIVVFVGVGVYATYGKISEGIEDKAVENGAEATVGYLARQSDMTVEDYLAQYGLELGDTITKKTTESEMLDNMSVEYHANYYGQDADELIETAGLQDQVTKDMPWKEFLDLVPAHLVVGDDEISQTKEQYGLGDEITDDTTYGEYNALIEEKQAEQDNSSEAADGEQPEDEPAEEQTDTAEAE